MSHEPGRPSPDQLLEQVEQEERRQRPGRLKVFLGYASGVGKSAQMLDEGRRRHERGEDVVVGGIQPRSSPEVERLLAQLEVVPPVKFAGQDLIDVTRIIQRRPQVVLIDGLAYDNPPGCRNPRRSDDVADLLRAGISVITSINLQYIQEFQDEIAKITGKKPVQGVPRTFLEKADEIVVVDAPAHDEKLGRLRQMALLFVADAVELQLEDYLRSHGIEETWGTQERILLCITPRSPSALIESGRRNADRFRGELYAVYVRQTGLSSNDQMALDNNLAIAVESGAHVQMLEDEDTVRAVIDFARQNAITQIFIGHSMKKRGWFPSLGKTTVERLIESAEGMDVRIFPQ